MASHVLVPIDDSEPSSAALEYVLAEHAGDRITALHVLDPSDFYAVGRMEGGSLTEYEQLEQYQTERGESILEEARQLAADRDVDIETETVIGSVGRSVLDYVDDHDVDQVVVGSHGRTGASRILLGSVAERIVRRSPVPVTVVR